MNTRGNNYKEKIMLMLDAGCRSKEILETVACSQGFVSRVKIKWETMCETQKRREIEKAEEILGKEAEKYKRKNDQKTETADEPEKDLVGFRTPYTALKRGRTVISRY